MSLFYTVWLSCGVARGGETPLAILLFFLREKRDVFGVLKKKQTEAWKISCLTPLIASSFLSLSRLSRWVCALRASTYGEVLPAHLPLSGSPEGWRRARAGRMGAAALLCPPGAWTAAT